jgi:hypothetical protein
MEGGKSDGADYGNVSTDNGPTGHGDSTSFGDADKVDSYTIRPGDNLWNIAAKRSVYGSGWLYPLLVKANKSKIGNTSDLKVGITLTVPRGLSQAEMEIAREDAMAGTYDSKAGGTTMTAQPYSLAVSQAAVALPAKPHKASSSFGWLLWLALAALLMALFWQWRRMRHGEAEEAMEAPSGAPGGPKAP